MSTKSQLSVATDHSVENGFFADVVSEKQLSMSQMREVVGSSLLKCWKRVGHRAMAVLAWYQSDGMMLMMCAAAVDTIAMKIVVTAAVVANAAASADVVAVIPEAVVVVFVKRFPAMVSSATM